MFKPYRALLLPLAALLMAQAPVLDSARLVRDIEEGPGFYGLTNLLSLASSGDRAFFLLDGVRDGLWTSTGSAGNMLYLGEFEAWNLSADTGRSAATETGLLFQDRYNELFSSDGTVEGTQHLFTATADLARPRLRSGLVPLGNGKWVFSSTSRSDRSGDLWVTDGTEAGSQRLATLQETVSYSIEQDVHSRLGMGGLFFGLGDSISESNLWLTDGTVEGTRILASIAGGFPTFLQGSHEDRSVFAVETYQERSLELWSTDGTEEGTRSLSLPALEGEPFNLGASARFGSGWVFIANPAGAAVGEQRCNLWVTDGSESGTRLVANLYDLIALPPGGEIPSGSCPTALVSTGDRIFFSLSDSDRSQDLWVTDGTQSGTRVLSDLAPEGERSFVRDLVAWNGGVAFRGEGPSGPTLLYVSDGTPEGTRSITDRGHVVKVHEMGGELWFTVYSNSPPKVELWVTGGNAASERRIDELAESQASSDPSSFLPFRDHLFFRTGGNNPRGNLRTTDGTSAGTEVFDLSSVWDFVVRPEILRVIGDELYLADQSSIIATDGTVAGTRTVVPWQLNSFDRPEFAKLGSRLFFSGDDGGEAGVELWIRDDAADEPEVFLDLHPGQTPDPEYPGEFYANSSSPSHLKRWQDRIVFSAYTDQLGAELWVTDGSRAGTRALPASPGATTDNGHITEILPIGDRIFFHRYTSGLWVSDGTPGGTRPVLGPEGEQLRGFEGVEIVELRGRCLLLSRNGSFGGGTTVLWLTDGTAEGTLKVTEVPASVSYDNQLVVSGGQAFMVLRSAETGTELWATDGTAEGTRLVKDIAPGPDSPEITNLRAVDGVVLFAAEDKLLGNEPWVSDGTAEGTRLLADVRPEKESSDPAGFISFQGDIYFSAFRNDVGRELFAMDGDLLHNRCVPSPRRLCLQDGRFTVEVDWRDQRRGGFGVGTSSDYSDDTGFFWFFREENVELVVKVLDGRERNEHFWYFSGALSDVDYWITVKDHENGRVQTFHNPPGNLCGRAETAIFREGDVPVTETNGSWLQAAPTGGSLAEGIEGLQSGEGCSASPNALLLQNGRFAVEVDWETARQGGRSGVGTPVPGTDESGYFWFFNPDNLELVLKVLDGRQTNGQFWVLYGALSDVGYEIRVTDLETCSTRTYRNGEGNVCGRADIQAF